MLNYIVHMLQVNVMRISSRKFGISRNTAETSGVSLMRPFHRPTKHAKIRENGQRSVEKRQQLYRDGQKVMSLVNFLLSSHCTVDKDILPGDIIKLRVYICQLSEELDPKATNKPY